MFDYWLWDSALPKWFCEAQINNVEFKDKGALTNVNAGHKSDFIVDSKYRETDITWADNESPIGCIARQYLNLANEKANWNFNVNFCAQVQLGKYDGAKKSFYDWHVDDEFKPDNNGLVRKLSISILLNDPKDFEGGLLEFKKFEKQPEMQRGSVIVFLSHLEHRVTPVTKGVRYSAVTWLSGPAYK
jgi:PKHD-type hydroxylase